MSDRVRDLKKVLNSFRLKLFLADLLKGGIVWSLFVMIYLLFYYLFISLSPITVSFKTVLYVLFISLSWIIILFFSGRAILFYIRSLNLPNDFLLKRMSRYPGAVDDVFTSVYHLAFHQDRIPGDKSLKKAALYQKYDTLSGEKKLPVFPDKVLIRLVVIPVVFIAIFFFNSGFFSGLYRGILNYEDVSNPKFNIEFDLLNETMEVENGKPFQLQLRVKSEYTEIDNVFVVLGGGEFLMNRKDSVYLYDFDVVNNDLRFNFVANGIESKMYKITVLPSPEVTDYNITCIPPRYTGLKSESFKNTVDFRVIYGSSLRFSVNFSNVDSLFMKNGDVISPVAMKNRSTADFVQRVKGSGDITLIGSNKHFLRKELITFNITSVADLYPGIQVTEIKDSLNTTQSYFYGVITDDFGFSDLRFSYSLNGRNPIVMPVQILKNINTQEFYFELNFAEFGAMDNTEVSYYFEVFDNDEISGPKSTRSDASRYVIPDLNTIFKYNSTANSTMNSSLDEAEKLAKEIVTGVKELQMKILENSSDNWEKQELTKEILEKKEKLDKLLESVKEENAKKITLNQNFSQQDSILMEKQKIMQELMDKVMDEEMQKLMEEFRKLAEEFSKEKFLDLDDQMKMEFDQLSERLDRNIDLLKSMQVEEQHRMISQQMDRLQEKQEEFRKNIKEGNISADSLKNLSEEIKKDLEDLNKNYKDLKQENESLFKPYNLNDFQDKFEKLSENLGKQQENAAEGNNDQGLSEEIQEQIDELAEEIEKQQEQNFMEMELPQNDIELVIQNILIVSFAQEDIMKEFKDTPPHSSRYGELGRLQEQKRQEYRIIKDTLSLLARQNMMLASLLGDKFYVIETKFGLMPDYIQNFKKSEMAKEQQYIITYLNDLALILTDALEQGQGEGDEESEGEESEGNKSGKSGKKSGKKKGGKGGEPDYNDLKNSQQNLKKSMENFLDQIKNGQKGKPLQQQMSIMIRENEMFRKSMEDFMNKTSGLSETERKLLNEINRLIDDNIKDLSNYSFSRRFIDRNNQIYNKLLISEKASKEREEYEEKRKSVTADNVKFDRPNFMHNSHERKNLIRSDFQRTGIILNPYYKNLYNNYFIRLGDE